MRSYSSLNSDLSDNIIFTLVEVSTIFDDEITLVFSIIEIKFSLIQSLSEKLSGFDVSTLCYDILDNVGDENAQQVSMEELMTKSEVISIHTPHTAITRGIIDYNFIEEMSRPFWLLNTARGSAVVTEDLVTGLKSGKIMGAGLDVLEYETRSFSSIFSDDKLPSALEYLMHAKNVILSPHVGGWTRESHIKLATTIVEKIKKIFF